MRGALIAVFTLSTILAAFVGCLEPEERPGRTESYAVTRCDEAGACLAGESCRDGLCLPDCSVDADCPASAVCVDDSCFGGASGSCGADAECAAGEACVGGLCVAYADVLECGSDADCPAGAACTAGECVFDPSAEGPELCNGLDDDGDGVVDEGCASLGCTSDDDCADGDPATTDACVDGVCVSGLDGCGAEGVVCPAGQTCVDGVCREVELPCLEEICNGLDDDCDGIVDEGCEPLPCASSADCDDGDPATTDACVDGVCVSGFAGCGAAGVFCAPGEVCLEGVCVAEPAIEPEVCGNGVDDDHDGLVDEGCGADRDGDGFAAVDDCDDRDASVHPAASELCNGLDDDCDGVVDERCESGSGRCAADADCAAGQVCSAGVCVAR
jgi:Cys-rich repeat protein